LLYCYFRGTLSPSFTPCKGDNIPLDPGNAAFGGFYYFKKENAVAVRIEKGKHFFPGAKNNQLHRSCTADISDLSLTNQPNSPKAIPYKDYLSHGH